MEFDKTTQDALKLIHEGNHIIFREVGRVCEKYHLNYFLDSGNLIGAVRWKLWIKVMRVPTLLSTSTTSAVRQLTD